MIDGMYLLITLSISMISSATGETIGQALSFANAPRTVASAITGNDDGTVYKLLNWVVNDKFPTTVGSAVENLLNTTLTTTGLGSFTIDTTHTTKEVTDSLF